MFAFLTNLFIVLPLAIIQLVLLLVALVHILQAKRFKVGDRLIWVLVVLLITIIGPVLYFILGRAEDE